MIIIGEKINGFLPEVAQAISSRDREYICRLAKLQVDCGADYLDLCAGMNPANEQADLAWLLEVVQDTVGTPVCIDSGNNEVILGVLPLVNQPGIVNSISGDVGKYDKLLRAVADTPWKVIALTCDSRGTSMDVDTRVSIASTLVNTACRYGIERDQVILDPMVMALAAAPDSVDCFTETAGRVRTLFPGVHITCGVSNVSYGMPCRSAVNRQFLAFAMQAGMDYAILDPTCASLRTALYATQALLGQDRNGKAFLRAYRKGVFRSTCQEPPNRGEP